MASSMSPVDGQNMLAGFEHDLRSAPQYGELRNDPQLAPKVYKLLQSGEYISFVIRTDAATTPEAKFMVDTRAARAPDEWWGAHTNGVVDMHNTTIIFMGRAGTFTAMHADWADAQNIAFAVEAKVRLAGYLLQ